MEPKVQHILNDAIAAHKAGDYSLAEQLYNDILLRDPNSSDACHNLGLIGLKFGHLEKALQLFERAIKSKDTVAQYWISYVKCLLQLERYLDAQITMAQARKIGAKGDNFDKLDEQINRVLSDGLKKGETSIKSPQQGSIDPPQEKLQRILALYNSNKIDEALGEIKKLSKKYQKSVVLAKLEGLSHAKSGNFPTAIKKYESVLEYGAQNSTFYFNLANAYLGDKNTLKAIENYEIAKTLDSEDPDVFNNLGNAYRHILNSKSAESNYLRAIELKKCPGFYNNFALLQLESEKYERCLDYLLEGLRIDREFKPLKKSIIDLTKYYMPDVSVKNELIHANFEIAGIYKSFNIDIQNKSTSVLDLIERVNEVLKRNLISDFDFFFESQIHRGSVGSLNCERHMSLFKKYEIIPKYCFGCFKVQINLSSVIDLILLYLVFDRNNPIAKYPRKTMVELRNMTTGHYKGFLYCSSLTEANELVLNLETILSKTLISPYEVFIKRGCSEYAERYPEYANLGHEDEFEFSSEWQSIENKFDNDNPTVSIHIQNLLNGMSLSDCLIIKNWIFFAKLIDDHSVDHFDSLSEIPSVTSYFKNKIFA